MALPLSRYRIGGKFRMVGWAGAWVTATGQKKKLRFPVIVFHLRYSIYFSRF